jgi:hypothetical protein
MPAISDLFRQGWPHDATCQCVPCLRRAYEAARSKAIACAQRYIQLRRDAELPDEMTRARTEWTAASQEFVLADHCYRAAEDRDKLAEIALRRAQAETPGAWNPPGWKPEEGL